MANNQIIGSPLDELPERLNFFDIDFDTLCESKKARLFPSGNSAKTAKEMNLTAIFLSTLAAIKPYREAMLGILNPKAKKVSNKTARLHVFTEICDTEPNGCRTDRGRPDGLIILTTGKARTIEWAAFVEVKVNADLNEAQVNRYLDIARKYGTDLITISDQIVSTPFQTPISEKLSTRNVRLYHWSWIYIRAKAQQVIESAIQIGCDITYDIDQIYILREFMRYLEDPKINVGHFTHMGAGWSASIKELRQLPDGARIDSGMLDKIATAWMHEEQDLCYHVYLKTRLKVYLAQTKSEKMDLDERKRNILDSLIKSKCLTFELSVPYSTSVQDALENSKRKRVEITVCFRSSSIRMATTIKPNPNQKAVGQTTSFINNLERIGVGMEDDLKITAIYKRKKKSAPISLKELQHQKAHKIDYTIVDKELGDQIELIEISQVSELGRRIFASPTNFIVHLEKAVTNFISQIYEA